MYSQGLREMPHYRRASRIRRCARCLCAVVHVHVDVYGLVPTLQTPLLRLRVTGLEQLSSGQRETFAEWSASFVAVKEHRPRWPWGEMLDGIDYTSRISDDNSFRHCLENIAAMLSGCTVQDIVRGEIVPSDLHVFLDDQYGALVDPQVRWSGVLNIYRCVLSPSLLFTRLRLCCTMFAAP